MVLIFEIVDCNPLKVVKPGVEVFKVTAKPADEPCIAGELDLDVDMSIIEGEALLKLVTEGEFLGPREVIEAADVELWRPPVADGEFLTPVMLAALAADGEFLMADGDARKVAGDETRPGRQCLTESEPDWESLLLLGEPGEETIT